jgi:hypothetical protein
LERGIFPVLIKKRHGRYERIFADIKEFTHGKKGTSRGYASDIAGTVTKIQAHFAFRDISGLTELCDAVAYILFIHVTHLLCE